MIDYNTYHMSLYERVKYSIIGFIGMFILGGLFYESIIISFMIGCLGIFYMPYKNQLIIKERKKRLKEQFKEALYALSSSISVGKSIELAFVEALKDLRFIYYSEDVYIIKEFEYIVRRISMNESIENALLDFALRAEDEDITNFTNVFITAKRTGGNLVEIMKYTNTIINEKMEIMENIEILVTNKKYEQKILALLVPFIILYLRVFSSGFLDVMYQTIKGRIAMSIALALYIISFVVGKRVVNIEV